MQLRLLHLFEGYMSNVLLRQLENVLTLWDTIGDPSLTELERNIQKMDVSRTALALFASGSGVFRPVLQRLFEFQFALIDALVAERSARVAAAPGATLSTAIAPFDAAEVQDAHDAARTQEMKMKVLVADAAHQRDELLSRIQALVAEKEHVEMLLSHQMIKHQRGSVVEDDTRKLIQRAEAEKSVDELSKSLKELREEHEVARTRVESLRELNAKYAAQSMELAARLHVVTEHNRNISATLTLQQHDLLSLDKQNEESRLALAEALRANKLLHEALESQRGVEHREVFVGLGTNFTVPRHLQCGDYVRHVPMTSGLARQLACDAIRSKKQFKNVSFGQHVAAFLGQRYGVDATAYGYALQLGCLMYDADVTLQAFGAVTSNRLSEEIFTILRQDEKIFVDACAAIDLQCHGDATLCVPFVHAMGVLAHMYPGYSPSNMEALWTALDGSLTNTGALFYGTLFPDTDRDELVGGESPATAAQETSFSSAFKTLILDDALRTMQKVEDHFLSSHSEMSTAAELMDRYRSLDICSTPNGEQAMAQFLDANCDPTSPLVTLRLLLLMRQTLLLRSGAASSSEGNHSKLMERMRSEWADLTGEAADSVKYSDVVGRLKRAEHFVGRRAIDVIATDTILR